MATYLMCSSPLHGHVSPLRELGAQLVERGHRVAMLTGRKYAESVQAAGLQFLPLPSEVDFDDAALDDWLPGRDQQRGLGALRHDMVGVFVRVIPGQHRALREAIAAASYDAVIGEFGFTGMLPLLLDEAGARPPVVGVSIAPLTFSSADTAPFGTALRPSSRALGRLRNRVLNKLVLDVALGPVGKAMDLALAEVGAPPAPVGLLDVGRLYDRVFHLGLPAFEYPRSDLPDNVRFVGPLLPRATGVGPPAWWPELQGRPVVHVTQGTVDSLDLNRLVVPTLRALADEDLLVVATTSGRPLSELTAHFPSGLPANARVGEMLPYDRLLPQCSAMVTNGGFGGVQQALAHGVPLVVAGATEDKPEVAARVAWQGAGINLRKGTPSPERIRGAVRRVLTEPEYAARASAYAADAAAAPPAVDLVLEDLERLVATPE